MSETDVIYRTLDDFPGYRFGSDGSVWTAWKRISLGIGAGSKIEIGTDWGLFKQGIHLGYPSVRLRHVSGKGTTRYTHRFLLEAFQGPRQPGLEACHNDGNKTNNHIDNLRWDTRQANTLDMYRHGHIPARGEKVAGAKLTEADVREIRRLHAGGRRMARLAETYGVVYETIREICHRKKWRHVTDEHSGWMFPGTAGAVLCDLERIDAEEEDGR